jgi:hypothetical protein
MTANLSASGPGGALAEGQPPIIGIEEATTAHTQEHCIPWGIIRNLIPMGDNSFGRYISECVCVCVCVCACVRVCV